MSVFFLPDKRTLTKKKVKNTISFFSKENLALRKTKNIFTCHNLPSKRCLYNFVFYRHISTVKSKHFVFQVYKKSCGQWKWKIQLDDIVLG